MRNLRCWTVFAMIGIAALAGAVGCQQTNDQVPDYHIVQQIRNTPPEPENQTPLLVDDAMQLRDWDRSTAHYANGNTIAGPTGFLFEPRWNQPEWTYAALETPLFMVQTLASPLVLIVTPPWTPIMYTGVTVGPTYTAMPVLPPAQGAAASSAPLAPVAPATQPY